jgi:hypothetical protein
VTGLAFPEHWPHAGEWWAVDAYIRGEGHPTVGFYFSGEHQDEIDVFELGHRAAAFLEGENPPYPGWTP